MRKGGSEQPLHRFAGIRGIRGWIQNHAFYICFYSNNCSDLTIVQCFFDFFIPLSSKTPTFQSFFGRLPARKALKSRRFSWEGYQKVKKTSRDSSDFKKPVFLFSFWTLLSQMLCFTMFWTHFCSTAAPAAHGLYRMDPQKTDQKHVFAKQQKNRDCKTCPIYSPLTPDQPPQRPLCYMRFPNDFHMSFSKSWKYASVVSPGRSLSLC